MGTLVESGFNVKIKKKIQNYSTNIELSMAQNKEYQVDMFSYLSIMDQKKNINTLW